MLKISGCEIGSILPNLQCRGWMRCLLHLESAALCSPAYSSFLRKQCKNASACSTKEISRHQKYQVGHREACWDAFGSPRVSSNYSFILGVSRLSDTSVHAINEGWRLGCSQPVCFTYWWWRMEGGKWQVIVTVQKTLYSAFLNVSRYRVDIKLIRSILEKHWRFLLCLEDGLWMNVQQKKS